MASNKRQRTARKSLVPAGPPDLPPAHSRILAPFRALGHITSVSAPVTPFTLLPLGWTFQLTTALSNTIQTYDIRRLNLVFASSPATPGPIRRIVAHRDVVYVAFEDPLVRVWIFKRGRKFGELETAGGGGAKSAQWRELLVFGEWVVAILEKGFIVWRRETGEVYTAVEMDVEGEITAAAHPNTLLNKMVIAKVGGTLEIWNVKTGKKIFTVPCPLPPRKKGPLAITSLVQTPVLGVLALGFSTGEIHLHDILTDRPIFTLNGSDSSVVAATSRGKGRVTGISFCTDPAVGAGKSKGEVGGVGKILAVGDDDGKVTLWDLKKRKVSAVMRGVHEGPSGGGVVVEWLAGQNVLISSGGDNSVKEWIFDSPHTTLPRLLRSRSGHSKPISALTFLNPTTSHFLLSASQDRSFWAHSMRNDAQSFELSQGKEVKKATKAAKRNPGTSSLADVIEESKAGPITCIATCSGEDGAGSEGREWEGIITGHRGERAARSWSFQNKRIGKWVLETKDGGEVKSVAISTCGTFGIVGSSGGGIDMFNLQSGLHRRRFPEPMTAAQAKELKSTGNTAKFGMIGRGKHTKAVMGVVTDSLNRVVISCGLDGAIKFWDFNTGILLHELKWGNFTAITRSKLHRHSDLLAVSCDDFCIRVVDIETRKTVRELWGASGRISDFCFSNDGRWIFGASTDSVTRVWDLPTGHLIDGFRTKSIVTAMAFSGSGEFLATAHVDTIGINLWTNRTLFRHVPTRHLKEEDITDLSSPTTSGEGGVGILEAAFDTGAGGEDESSGIYTTMDQLSDKILTMSLVPKTRWQTLLNLELIKQRNKPKEAPKASEKAPFFLPSLRDASNPLNPSQDSTVSARDSAAESASLEAERSRVLRMSRDAGESVFTQLLRKANGEYTSFLDHLKTLPPSSADLEIRSLQPDEMVPFVEAMTQRLKSRRDYELVQTWVSVFLKCHGEAVMSEEELRSALAVWMAQQKKESARLTELVGYCSGVAGFLRSGR